MLTRGAVIVCAVLAVLLARAAPSRRQRGIARLLCGLAAIDVVRPLVLAWGAVPVALLCAWYAATAWGVWAVLGKDETPSDVERWKRSPRGFDASSIWARRPPLSRPVLFRAARLLCLALAILASSVLSVRLGLTVQLAGVAFLLALAVELYAVTRYALRWEQPDAARGVALVLVCSSLADLAGPWALRQPVRDWWIGQAVAVATWAVVAVLLTVALVRGKLRDREA